MTVTCPNCGEKLYIFNEQFNLNKKKMMVKVIHKKTGSTVCFGKRKGVRIWIG